MRRLSECVRGLAGWSVKADVDVLIIGGGPAGLSTGLALQRRDPGLARRTLVLEAAHYPRPKLCGGGITFYGEAWLHELGIAISVPHVTITTGRLHFRHRVVQLTRQPALFKIVRRDEFDAALAQTFRERGGRLQEGTRICQVLRTADGFRTETANGEAYTSRALVVADGANSTIRRQLGWRESAPVGRLLEVVHLTGDEAPIAAARADLDFSCLAQGVGGYVWDFPCRVNGQPAFNRGIYDANLIARPRASLRPLLEAALRQRQVDPQAVAVQGHPERFFDPRARFSAPGVLLVGDAAGVDPLLGEGISFSVRYGQLAAAELQAGFTRGDLAFTGYRQRLLTDELGKGLRWRVYFARFAYRPWPPGLIDLFFSLWSRLYPNWPLSQPPMQRIISG